MLQHLGLVKAKALVEHHGHHLGAQVHHLHQKADFCTLLLQALADFWRAHPEQAGKVIAAGSTGSIPATAGLLDAVSALPQGRVILPGLDLELDQESWDALDETHPQYQMKRLLPSVCV